MNTHNLITGDSWTHMAYKSSDLLAFITLGAAPSQDNEAQIIYYVTLLKDLEKEIFQLEFSELASAIDDINKRYSHWELVDRAKLPTSSGGCSTCEAH